MTVETEVTPTWVGERMIDLLNCLDAELARTLGGTPCWIGLLPGENVALASCGGCEGASCGSAYIRLVSAFHSDNFPNQAEVSRCATPIAYSLEIGVLRCITVEEDGSDPSADDMIYSTMVQMDDMRAMERTVACCAGTAKMATNLEPYQPVGPEGGCVGGVLPFEITPD